jgi:hypothetical protein
MKWMKLFITGVAGVLVAFLVIGLLLPGDWSAERDRLISAPPGAVAPWVTDLARWSEWSSMEQVEGELSDPSSGVGATLSWDDPQWGQGVFTLTEVDEGAVAYEVRVEDGSLRTRGRLTLTPEGAGTRVVWREEGDFGRNPLLAWFALGMNRLQGAELEKGLDALAASVEER